MYTIQFNSIQFSLLILNPPDIGLQSNKHKQKNKQKGFHSLSKKLNIRSQNNHC